MTGDVDRYRRDKLRRQDRELEHLRAHRSRLELIVGLLANRVANLTGCDPWRLLAELERLLEEATRPRREIPQAELLELLREPVA